MEEDKQEQKEQDKPVYVPLEDKKAEKEEVTKCCGSSDCSCWSDLLSRIRRFFSGFSLGCSSTNCLALHTQKTVSQKIEEKKEEVPKVPQEKENNVV
jgi:hypothetical protein